MATVAQTNGNRANNGKSLKKNGPLSWMSRRFASLRGNGKPKKRSQDGITYSTDTQIDRPSSSPASPRLNHRTSSTRSRRSQDQYTDRAEQTERDVNTDGHQPGSNNSVAPTLATNPDTLHSDTGKSRADTAHTTGGGMSTISGGGNSIFSSSNHSARSLTTTLTTIQSTTPMAGANGPGTPTAPAVSPGHTTQPSQSSTYFTHQHASHPASAIPAHVNAGFQPSTYRSATANGLLSDNASVMTLASSRQIDQRRRTSLDTNASTKAIPPSSQYGGSRESLPLSVFSQNTDAAGTDRPVHQSRPSIGGLSGPLASAERASVYSSSGVNAPALSSERNSVYAGRLGNRETTDTNSIKGQEDSRSMKSGIMGRTDSIAGSIGGIGSSPLATPKDPHTPLTFSTD